MVDIVPQILGGIFWCNDAKGVGGGVFISPSIAAGMFADAASHIPSSVSVSYVSSISMAIFNPASCLAGTAFAARVSVVVEEPEGMLMKLLKKLIVECWLD